MTSKETILNNIKSNIGTQYDMPDFKMNAIQYPDKIARFSEVLKSVGGVAYILKPSEDVNEVIKTIYPDAKVIASNIPGINCANLNPDKLDDAHKLTGIDLAVVNGELGVAENACVWIPQNVVHKAIYFIAEEMVLLLDKDNLVNNMHEAYQQITFNESGFGIFISGPSKTADIEQALVIGAHGVKGLTVILK
ncbi:MAG: LUD domain-containing protein [Paludibacter sp.]|nr:LUD domain-containing protein [Paludibacter sp.]